MRIDTNGRIYNITDSWLVGSLSSGKLIEDWFCYDPFVHLIAS